MTENNCRFRVDDCRCALKLYADKLIRRVSDIDAALLLQGSSREQTAKTEDSFRGEPNDGPRKENVRLEKAVKNVEKKLNGTQQIVNVVAELLRYCTKENPPYATINRLRTLSTSIMTDLKEVINASCTATSDKGKTAETAQIKNGVKRRRADVYEREHVEHGATKRQKTVEDNSEMSTTANDANSITQRSATSPVANENRNCLEIGESRELQTNDYGTIKQDESNEKLLKFTSVIAKELLPYYKKNYFLNADLFKFTVKTIVYRLMDSNICPEEHTVKSTIWQMMPEMRIKSKHQVLKILEPFY